MHGLVRRRLPLLLLDGDDAVLLSALLDLSPRGHVRLLEAAAHQPAAANSRPEVAQRRRERRLAAAVGRGHGCRGVVHIVTRKAARGILAARPGTPGGHRGGGAEVGETSRTTSTGSGIRISSRRTG